MRSDERRCARAELGGVAIGNLRQILDGSAGDQQREVFADAWHRRVRVVLDGDWLFTVETV